MGGICWLASYPKSGNTWLRIFLRNLLYEADSTADINQLELMRFQDVQKQWYEMAAGGSLDGMSREKVHKLTTKAQEIMSQAIPDTLFVKTHSLLGVEQLGVAFINMNVTAGAINVVRNPLDVVISTMHHFGLKDIDDSIRFMNKDWSRTKGSEGRIAGMIGSWRQNVDSWGKMHPDALLVLRYEDMLHKPLEAFGAVNKFLGANKSTELLERAIELSSFDQLKSKEAEKGYREASDKTEKFFRSGKSEQWKTELTKDQIKRIVDTNYKQMKHFGYIPEGYE